MLLQFFKVILLLAATNFSLNEIFLYNLISGSTFFISQFLYFLKDHLYKSENKIKEHMIDCTP